MEKYIINGKELNKEDYINILQDLIQLAKDEMPLEVRYVPIPNNLNTVQITLPCGHLHKMSYWLLLEWGYEMFSCNTPGCKTQITRALLLELLYQMGPENIIDLHHSKEYYGQLNN